MKRRPQVIAHLCAEAAAMHKAISTLPDRYTTADRLALTNQLVGVRSVLAFIHGGGEDPTVPSTDPGAAILAEWWQRTHPKDWTDDQRRRRHAEQLYFSMHRLLTHGEHSSIPKLAHDVGMPVSTTYFVLANPARARWRTLEPLVLTLGGHRDELWTMWSAAFKPPKATIPPRGPALTLRKV